MTNERKQSGATLALVVVCTIIIIMVGVGAFFLMQLLGGQREMQDASDSGDLNVAKQVLLRPNVRLNELPAVVNNNFGTQVNNRPLVLDDPDRSGQPVINLNCYNQMVGQALIVGMNAESFANRGNNQGVQNARQLFQALQGPGGAGQMLSNRLGATQNTADFFNSLNLSNNTRMVNQNTNNTGLRNDAQHAVGYMESRQNDVGATNLRLGSTTADALALWNTILPTPSAGIPAFNNIRTTSNGVTYVRGYRALQFNRCGTLVGVPVQPGEQPHLVSAVDFNVQQGQPVPGQIVPPNAFQRGLQQKSLLANQPLNSLSRALVGIPNVPLNNSQPNAQFANSFNIFESNTAPPSVPGGYLRVFNAGGVPSTGTLFNPNTVLNDELDNPGIEVCNGYFSASAGKISAWRSHNSNSNDPLPHGTSPDQNKDAPAAPYNNANDIYDQNGDPLPSGDAGRQAAHNIQGPLTTCTDNNTFPPPGQPGGSSGGNTTCNQMLPKFEKAYTPGFTGDYQSAANLPGNSLTALEQTKCAVMGLFNTCGSIGGTTRRSGQQVYVNNCLFTNCPWPQNHGNTGQRCNISNVGTLQGMINQSDPPGGVDWRSRIETYIQNRLRQMNPVRCQNASNLAADLNFVMRGATYPMLPNNRATFIYYDFSTNPRGVIRVDQNIPPGAITQANPDGPRSTIARNYDTAVVNNGGGPVNPPLENHIHDQLYKCPGGQLIRTREQVNFNESTFFNNLGGELVFSEEVSFPTGAPSFCCPD